jgi:hypothetical protein
MLRSVLSVLLISAALCARTAHAGTTATDTTALPTLRICPTCADAGLRLAPERDAQIIQPLAPRTKVTLLQRAPDESWFLVRSRDGLSGWVMREELSGLKRPAAPKPARVPAVAPPAPKPAVKKASAAKARAAKPALPAARPGSLRAIYQQGQKFGNRADVFSKVGDSLTAVPYVMYPIGWGNFNLHSRVELQPVADHFRRSVVRDGNNSFINNSLAAYAGWTSADVLNHSKADPAKCFTGETPLRCEYRLSKPAVALIMFGTNDVSALSAEQYRANMTQIVRETIDAGVIPVLSTIPPRMQLEGQCNAFNAIVVEIAQVHGVPLSDYASAMKHLPNYGLSEDGVHPSWPPGDFALSADFSDANMNTGYTLRNFMILQSLDAVWRQAMH